MAYEALKLDGSMSQYLLGSNIMICPIVSKKSNDTNLVEDKKIWIPDGNWFEINSGEYFTGEQWYNRSWDMTEVPMFVKSGSIIPRRQLNSFQLSNAQRDFSELVFDIFPGSDSAINSYLMYEDDGLTQAYVDRQYTVHNLTSTYTDLTHISFTVSKLIGKPL